MIRLGFEDPHNACCWPCATLLALQTRPTLGLESIPDCKRREHLPSSLHALMRAVSRWLQRRMGAQNGQLAELWRLILLQNVVMVPRFFKICLQKLFKYVIFVKAFQDSMKPTRPESSSSPSSSRITRSTTCRSQRHLSECL